MTLLLSFFRKNGVFSIHRLMFRGFLKGLNKINTYFYSIALGRCGSNCLIEYGVRVENPKNVFLGDNVIIKKGSVLISELADSSLTLCDGVQINNNVWIDHTGEMTIGENCMISDGVKIYSHSHGYNPRSKPVAIKKVIAADIWVGTNVIVLESAANIGAGSILAAGALVSKNVDSNVVVGGNPARIIKRLKV